MIKKNRKGGERERENYILLVAEAVLEGSRRESTTGRCSGEGTGIVQSCRTKADVVAASRRTGRGGVVALESQQEGEDVVFFEVEAIVKDSQAHQFHPHKSLHNSLTYNTAFLLYHPPISLLSATLSLSLSLPLNNKWNQERRKYINFKQKKKGKSDLEGKRNGREV
jgi:hypothetical protein